MIRSLKQCSKSVETILRHTQFVRRPSLTSEAFGLHLITPECALWRESGEQSPFHLDPFWAIYWPGGQALSRFILDQPDLVKGRNVLDLGAGSGACAMAAILSGADKVCVNDIDPMALQAAKLNFQSNEISCDRVTFSDKNFLSMDDNRTDLEDYDVMLVGDMYFDEDLGECVTRVTNQFIKEYPQRSVWVGDPGRWMLASYSHRRKANLKHLATYELPDVVKAENYGLLNGFVYAVRG